MLRLSDTIGALRPGMDADVTVLTQKPGRYILRDNEKTEVVADSVLQPRFCLRAGNRHDAVAPILPQAVAA
jgi:dihydroorotase